MAIYRYSEAEIELAVASGKRNRLWLGMVACAALASTAWLIFVRPPWFHRISGIWMAVVTALFLHPLIRGVRNRKSFFSQLEASLRHVQFEVSAQGVTYRRLGPVAPSLLGASNPWMASELHLGRGEIVRAEEMLSGWRPGLFLRTQNRYRWLRIPRDIDGYDALKGELVSMGVAIVPASIGPNWEEFVFVLLFVMTLAGPMLIHDFRIRVACLIAAVLLIVPGVLISRASISYAPEWRTKIYLGACLPALLNLLDLWILK